jgi:signal transduction histidine kinase
MDAFTSRPRTATYAKRSLTRRLRTTWVSLSTAARSRRAGSGELGRFAEERDALRHVATLVARGDPPSMIFEAVAGAVGRLARADYTAINRCESGQMMSNVTTWRDPRLPAMGLPLGQRWPLRDDGPSTAVLQHQRPTRWSCGSDRGDLDDWARAHGIGHAVACPVTVGGRLWGVMIALYRGSDPPPEGTRERMGAFVELLNCAMTQAETHAELIAARSRLVTGAEATRRRMERDLHDGAQQHLIALALRVHELQTKVPPGQRELGRQLGGVGRDLEKILTELQEIARGLHPSVFTRQGLEAALKTLIHRSPVPVRLTVRLDGRLPEDLQVTVYYVVSEALTNILKHACASRARVDLRQEDSRVRLTVHDDGVGGADYTRGSGLAGLKDRVEALGGTIDLVSPVGEGTSLLMTFPAPAGFGVGADR